MVFWLVTAIYLFLTWFTFSGFNGSDDLHYAMLASNVLKGTYTPFAVTDIFSGRVLLVWWQALIYYAGGIHVFTTQAGTTFTIILCCYLTLFKTGRCSHWRPVLAGAALFYFNPVLKEAGTGVLPDVYIMLAGILVLQLWSKVSAGERHPLLNGALCGLIAFAAMFFKENALLFVPFLFLISLTGNRRKTVWAAGTAMAVFIAGVLLSGLVYYYYTGNFFFRVLQINNAAYPNPCSYSTYSVHEKLVRLTYGVWQQFITGSFYPVILAAFMLLLRLLFDKTFTLKKNNLATAFLVLLLLGLYFPFSLKGYQPLCFMPRHFIFLLPPAVLLCVSFLEEAGTNKMVRLLFIAASIIILPVCIKSTGLKWYWMLYGLLLAYFSVSYFIKTGLSVKLKYAAFAAILMLYMLYPVFFIKNNWFGNMRVIAKQTAGNVWYFPEHDNMMHFRLLHQFKDEHHFYSLEKNPFKIFYPYYEKADSLSFKSGWLIVNKAYTVLPPAFFTITDSLKANNYFSRQVSEGSVDAFYINSAEKLEYIRSIVAGNETIAR